MQRDFPNLCRPSQEPPTRWPAFGLAATLLGGTLLASLLGAYPSRVQSAELPGNRLSSLPSKCVSLKRGLVCYQQLNMRWQAADIGDYCIVQLETALPQKCWLQQQSGELAFEFISDHSQQYALRQRGSNIDLATVQIEVKWVYKQHRKDSFKWRVF